MGLVWVCEAVWTSLDGFFFLFLEMSLTVVGLGMAAGGLDGSGALELGG